MVSKKSDPLKANNTLNITKTRLYNFDPLKPHFYIVKLGFTEENMILSYSVKT